MTGVRTATRLAWAALPILLLVVLPAFGDNCSGGQDCANTQGFQSATLAALFALLAVAAGIGLDFIPGVGEVKGLMEAVRGVDTITGAKLAWWERGLAALGAIPLAGIAFRGLRTAIRGARGLDRAADALRAADRAGDALRVAGDVPIRGTAFPGTGVGPRNLSPPSIGRMDRAVRNRLQEIGVPDNMIHPQRAFNPMDMNGGGNIPGVGIEVDAGVLRGSLPDVPGWDQLSTTTRVDAIAAHEYEELLARTAQGMDVAQAHAHAVQNAANTTLNISDEARAFLQGLAGGG